MGYWRPDSVVMPLALDLVTCLRTVVDLAPNSLLSNLELSDPIQVLL